MLNTSSFKTTFIASYGIGKITSVLSLPQISFYVQGILSYSTQNSCFELFHYLISSIGTDIFDLFASQQSVTFGNKKSARNPSINFIFRK